MDSKVVTRFAPSPTGFLHMGSLRTALFAYFYARQNSGTFVLRIEDTDHERNKKEFDDGILSSMEWLGLSHDEFFRQSERKAIYKEYIEKLIAEDKAYISKETVTEENKRSEVIRFRNPNKKVAFDDMIRGQIEFDTTELEDFVIARSIDDPVFHFVVVLDDYLMGITHVIRGDDHISNTPRQILIQEALGAPRPLYAHLPIILAEDKSKLSKRKHGERVSINYYMQRGYLPGALINYLSLLGWNPGTDQEIFTVEELIKAFDLSKVQKSGAIFNEEKLKWFNKEHMKLLPMDILTSKIRESLSKKYPDITDAQAEKLAPVALERASTFGEVEEMAEAGEFDYFFSEPVYESSGLLWKGKGELSAVHEKLTKVVSLLTAIPEQDFNKDTVKTAIWDYATEIGRGEVLWPMRFALSGKEKSPDPFILSELLGKRKTIERLTSAASKISS